MLRRFPPFSHARYVVRAERVHERAPIVAHCLVEQLARIGLQGLAEQASAVEGVFAQHAVAPAMDGRNRGLVHRLSGELQTAGAGGPLRGRVVGAQCMQQFVSRRLRTDVCRIGLESGCGFRKSPPNPVPQLLGRSFGEGDHQNLRRVQFAAERSIGAAVIEHQAQEQRADGVGLAGAGTGLHQTGAAQRKCQ